MDYGLPIETEVPQGHETVFQGTGNSRRWVLDMELVYDYTLTRYIDFAICAAVVITAILWKEQRWYLVGFGGVYLMAAIGFHYDILPEGFISY